MVALLGLVGSLALASSSLAASVAERKTTDYCAEIAGQAYADPATVLSCLRSFPSNETIKENVLAVVGGALDFFTFVYSLLFKLDVHETDGLVLGLKLNSCTLLTLSKSLPSTCALNSLVSRKPNIL